MEFRTVSPSRVRSLILSALDMFSKGDKDGKFWVQGTEKTGTPIVGNRYGFCSIGAIHNVQGFSSEEKEAAKIALAKIINDDFRGGNYLAERTFDYGEEKVTFEDYPDLAEELIVEMNDDEDTSFGLIRDFFNDAAAALKRG